MPLIEEYTPFFSDIQPKKNGIKPSYKNDVVSSVPEFPQGKESTSAPKQPSVDSTAPDSIITSSSPVITEKSISSDRTDKEVADIFSIKEKEEEEGKDEILLGGSSGDIGDISIEDVQFLNNMSEEPSLATEPEKQGTLFKWWEEGVIEEAAEGIAEPFMRHLDAIVESPIDYLLGVDKNVISKESIFPDINYSEMSKEQKQNINNIIKQLKEEARELAVNRFVKHEIPKIPIKTALSIGTGATKAIDFMSDALTGTMKYAPGVTVSVLRPENSLSPAFLPVLSLEVLNSIASDKSASKDNMKSLPSFTNFDLSMYIGDNLLLNTYRNLFHDHTEEIIGEGLDKFQKANLLTPLANTIGNAKDHGIKYAYEAFDIPKEEQNAWTTFLTYSTEFFSDVLLFGLGARAAKGVKKGAKELVYTGFVKAEPILKSLRNSPVSKYEMPDALFKKITSNKSPNINDPKYTGATQKDKQKKVSDSEVEGKRIVDRSGKLSWVQEQKRNADAAIGAAGAMTTAEHVFEDSPYKDAVSLTAGLTGAMLGISGIYKGNYFPKIGPAVSVETLSNTVKKYYHLSNFLIQRKARKTLGKTGEDYIDPSSVDNLDDIKIKQEKFQEARSDNLYFSRNRGADPSLESKMNMNTPQGEMDHWLKFLGWSAKDIRGMEQKAVTYFIDTKKRLGDSEETFRQLKQLGLVKNNGEVNLNYYKQDYAVATPDELEFMREMGNLINSIDDPEFLRGLQRIAVQSRKLFEDLGTGLGKSPEGSLEKFEKLHYSVSQVILLDLFQNAQAALIGKTNFSNLGGFKKQDFFNQAAELEGLIERQSRTLLDNFNAMRFTETNLSQDKIDLAEQLKNRMSDKVLKDLERQQIISESLRKKIEIWDSEITKRNQAKISSIAETLQLEDLSKNVLKRRQHGYNVYTKIFGKKNDAYPFWNETSVGTPKNSQTGSSLKKRTLGPDMGEEVLMHRDGKLVESVKTSNKRYEDIFKKGDDLNIDIKYLERDVMSLLNNSGVFSDRISSIVKDVPAVLADKRLIFGLRKRGLKFQRDKFNNDEEYIDFLEQVSEDLPNFSRWRNLDSTEGTYLDDLETLIAEYENFSDIIPTKMNVREWHGIRSYLLKQKGNLFRSGRFDEFNSYKQATEKWDNLIEKDSAYMYLDEIPDERLKNKLKSVKEDLLKAGQLHKKEVVPFYDLMYRRLQNNKGIAQTQISPENMFEMFFTSKNGEFLKRNEFNRLFVTKSKEGKIVVDKEAVELLRTSFGYALTKGNISSNLHILQGEWGDLLGKEYNDLLTELIQGRVLITKGRLPELKELKEDNTFIKRIVEKIDDADQTYFRTLADSLYGLLSYRTYQDISKKARQGGLVSNVKQLGLIRESIISSLFFRTGTDGAYGIGKPSLAQKIAMSPDAKKEALTEFDKITLKKEVRDEYEKLLPEDSIGKVEGNAMDEIIEEFGLNGRNPDKTVLTKLSDLFVEELTLSSIKFTQKIDVRRAGVLDLYNGEPIIKLGEKLDLQTMLAKYKVSRPELQKLFIATHGEKIGKQHLKNLDELMEVNTIINFNRKAIAMGGVAGGYTTQMALGRAYNVMKGVLSPRYAIMEAGVMQMRLARQDLTKRMFTDPSAASIVVDSFIKGKTDPQTLKKLNLVFAAVLGEDLNKTEKSKIKNLVNTIADKIRMANQPNYSEIKDRIGSTKKQSLEELQRKITDDVINIAPKSTVPSPDLSLDNLLEQQKREMNIQ